MSYCCNLNASQISRNDFHIKEKLELNTHFNNMDILLKQILALSQKDEMFKEGAFYLRNIYYSDNRVIMQRFFTEA